MEYTITVPTTKKQFDASNDLVLQMVVWSPTPVVALEASSNIWYGSWDWDYGSRSCKVSHLVMVMLGLLPQYWGHNLHYLQSSLVSSSQLWSACHNCHGRIMTGIFTIIGPEIWDSNISFRMENQFLAKVTALSAVSEQGELQFWLLCISTSITIFLWDWLRWRTVRAIFIIYS